MKGLLILASILLASAAFGCRGEISDRPPLHVVPDMDFQPKRKTQSRSDFEGWADHRGMRLPVTGTIARGALREGPLHTYKTGAGTEPADFVTDNPLALTMEVMERGRERFDITCAMCHGYSGRGGNGPEAHGMVGRYWPVAIASFIAPPPGATEDEMRVSSLNNGQIFDVITNGKGTMPSYAHMISAEDRWAIIHYIRALQYQALN